MNMHCLASSQLVVFGEFLKKAKLHYVEVFYVNETACGCVDNNKSLRLIIVKILHMFNECCGIKLSFQDW